MKRWAFLASLALLVAATFSAPAPAMADHALYRSGVQLHWERFGYNNAQMYVEDNTGYDWPVYASQAEWNASCCVGAYYSSPGNCPFHCVPVYEGYYGLGADIGDAFYEYDLSTGHFIEGSNTYVQFNDSYSLTADQHRSVTCQELGHIIGLDHRAELSSCMHQDPYDNPSIYPDDHDYGALATEVYNH